MKSHGSPCRVLFLSASKDHEADVLEGWRQYQTSLSQGNWPCEIIHFTFEEVCTGADVLTLLDLLDHVREGYFSCVFLSPPDDPTGQQPMRTRSQPLGLDGLCPKATRIVSSTNQHAELTARFAQQALLCTAHRVATVLIIPEDLGGHTTTGLPSLWSMTEFQSLEGLDDAHRGAGCSCQLGFAVQGLTTGILSNLSSASSVLYRGWPQLQPTSAATSSLVYRGPLQKTCSCTSQHTLTGVAHSLGSAFWRQCFDGFKSADSLRAGSKVWSAKSYTPRPSSHSSSSFTSGTGSLHHILELWERRHLTRGALRTYTGDIEFYGFFDFPASSAALERRRSSLPSRCTFSYWPPLTVSLSPSSSGFSGFPVKPESPRVSGTPRAEKTGRKPCQLDDPNFSRTFPAEETGWKPCHLACPRVSRTSPAKETGWKSCHLACPSVSRTLPAKETGSRSFHLQEVNEVVPTIPEAGPVSIGGRIGGTGQGRMQRSFSARQLRMSSQPALTTETPLATVPRGDGNVGRGGVDVVSSDGSSDLRSILRPRLFLVSLVSLSVVLLSQP